MSTPMMACGHAANATCEGKPVCAICIGIKYGAEVIVKDKPSLEGRKAKCVYDNGKTHPSRNGGRPMIGLVDSSWELPFFEYLPDNKTDRYYCGCYGWD